MAADEVDWDYAPDGVNKMMGMKFEGYAATFMQQGAHSIGKVYRKAIYREYTDSSFTVLKPRGPEWQYLGILGPVLHAEVGDTLRVVFKNNASRPYSMHPANLREQEFTTVDFGLRVNRELSRSPRINRLHSTDLLMAGPQHPKAPAVLIDSRPDSK